MKSLNKPPIAFFAAGQEMGMKPEIIFDEVLECNKDNICKHCSGDFEYKYWGEHRPPSQCCSCPRMLKAYNEAGHNWVTICIDCLLEELEKLK